MGDYPRRWVYTPILALVLALVLTPGSGAFGWSVDLTANFTGSSETMDLTIGAAPGCDDGFDDGFDVPFIPPPSGDYAAFSFSDSAHPDMNYLVEDWRSDADTSIVWRVVLLTDSGLGDSCYLTWNPAELPVGSFEYVIPPLGEEPVWSGSVDMNAASQSDTFPFFQYLYIRFTSPLDVRESNKPESGELSLHPNPFNSAVTISGNGGRLEILDISGRVVYRGNIPPGEFRWSPENDIPAGTYLIRLSRGGITHFAPALYIK